MRRDEFFREIYLKNHKKMQKIFSVKLQFFI